MISPPAQAWPEFEIVAAHRSGGLHRICTAAADAEDASRLVEASGLFVLSCNPTVRSLKKKLSRRIPVKRIRLDIALFAQEFASLLDAGLGIIDVLETLAEKEHTVGNRLVIEKMVQSLKEGRTFSAVLGEWPDIFPQLLVASTAASEQTGNMVTAFRRYSANFEVLRNIRSKAVGAAVYPLLLLGVGTLVVLFLLAVVVPKFSVLIESTHGEIPFASQMLIYLGKTIHSYPQVATFVTITTFFFFIWCVRLASNSGWDFPFVQRLPIVGSLIRIFRHSQFYRTSAMLVEGGIPAVKAFDMCGTLLTSGDHARLKHAVESIREGVAIGPAFKTAGLADGVAFRMLAVAQHTGKLADILYRVASFKEAALMRAVDIATRLFEPLLMIFIGLIIGGIVILMYLPIFDLASSIQ